MNRAIVIALGGTGTKVVEDLRTRLKIYAGTDSPPECRFIYADTDFQNNKIFKTRLAEACKMTVDDRKVAFCKNSKSDLAQELQIDAWMTQDRIRQLTPLSKGADGVRAYGRLAFLAGEELPKFINLVETAANQLAANALDQHNNGGANAVTLRVFVVASAGGGSGSGFFMDAGYLTRMLLRNVHIEQVGIIAVAPEHFTLAPGASPGKKQNSAALLDEMDHFARHNTTFTATYSGRPLPTDIGEDPPYQSCYIVSPMAGGGALDVNPARAVEIMEQRIADMIFMRLVGPGEIGARQSDFTTNFNNKPNDNLGYPNAFQTFGAGIRWFPYYKYLEEADGKAIVHVANNWLGVSAVSDTLIAEFCTELGIPSNDVQDGNKLRDAKADALLQNMVAHDSVSLLGILRSAESATILENLFTYRSGADVNPASDGFVAGVIQNNRDRILKRLKDRLREEVHKLAFDLSQGLGTARKLLDTLDERIVKETKFIEGCRSKLSVIAPGAVAAPVRSVRDPLLFGPLSTLTRPTARAGATVLDPEKNRRMEAAVLDAKLHVYREFDAECNELRKSLNQLEKYIGGWRDQTIAQLDPTWRQDCPDTVVLADKIVAEKIERFRVRPEPEEIEPVQKEYQSPTFVAKLPRTDRGAINYAPFEPIEQAVKNALRAEYDAEGKAIPATETIRGESVVRLLGELNGDNWPPDTDRLLRNSWPMLQLNLADTDYKHLLPPTPDGFPNPVEDYWMFNNATAHPGSHKQFCDSLRARYATVNGGTPIVAPVNLNTAAFHIEPAVAGLIYLRGSFPTRIIRGLTPEDRLLLLGDSQLEHYSRADVIPPVAPQDLKEAEARLMLMEALFLDDVLPPSLNIEQKTIDGSSRCTVTLRQVGACSIDGASWETAIHELAVNKTLCKKFDELIENEIKDPLEKGELVAAVSKLRVEFQDKQSGHFVGTARMLWAHDPDEALVILDRIDAQYHLGLTDSLVREARVLLLTILTLIHAPDVKNEVTKRLPHLVTDKGHIFDYTRRSSGIGTTERLVLSKSSPTVASRTLAANSDAMTAFRNAWDALKNLPGGTGDIQNALMEMLKTLKKMPTARYCREMDMMNIEMRDEQYLIDAVQPILSDEYHPWAAKDKDGHWRCAVTLKTGGVCDYNYGGRKPDLREECTNAAYHA